MSIALVKLETSTTMAGPKNASRDSSWEPDQSSRTWSGASACVPTCGLEVNDETLTLAPADIDDAHPQVNGVSPGHSGVSGFSVTLMSRSKGSLPFIPCPGLFLSHEPLCRLYHLLYSDAEMLIDGLCGSGCAEALETQNDAIVAHPAIPRHRMRRFHRDTLDALR